MIKISEKEFLGHEQEIEKKINELSSVTNSDIEGLDPICMRTILHEININWDLVATLFQKNLRAYDNLLFKIHFKRKKVLSEKQNSNICKFLVVGYLNTRDVRYFNEFLYFFDKKVTSYLYFRMMIKLFFDNMSNRKNHSFPLCKREKVDNYIAKNILKIKKKEINANDTSMNIGLLGSPSFFKTIYIDLKKIGFKTKIYFIPMHPTKLVNFIFKNNLLFKIFLFIKNVKIKYKKFNLDYKDPEIEYLLKHDNLDIGFHKLGFIIKDNIINSFKIGLINDHWAILPFIRGRSTIEYSLLFGFPVGASTHLITEKIDMGKIINIFNYDKQVSKMKSIKNIKNFIRKKTSDRALSSICLLSKNSESLIKNQEESGLMYYSMHPAIHNYIEKYILN